MVAPCPSGVFAFDRFRLDKPGKRSASVLRARLCTPDRVPTRFVRIAPTESPCDHDGHAVKQAEIGLLTYQVGGPRDAERSSLSRLIRSREPADRSLLFGGQARLQPARAAPGPAPPAARSELHPRRRAANRSTLRARPAWPCSGCLPAPALHGKRVEGLAKGCFRRHISGLRVNASLKRGRSRGRPVGESGSASGAQRPPEKRYAASGGYYRALA